MVVTRSVFFLFTLLETNTLAPERMQKHTRIISEFLEHNHPVSDIFSNTSCGRCIYLYVPGSKLPILGMVIPPLIGKPCNGHINPYYKVDDHPCHRKRTGV